MDRKKIIGEVAARHGVRIDEDDPAFVMATITELTLTDAQADLIAAIRLETAEFARAAGEVQEQAGARFGLAMKESVRQTRSSAKPNGSYLFSVLLIALGFIIGRWSAL